MKKDVLVRQRFEKIFSQTSGYIYGLAVRDARSLADAEDAFQETYVDLLNALEKGREIMYPKSYLASVLRRKLSALYRSQSSARETSIVDNLMSFEFDDTDIDDYEIEEKLVTEELIDKLAELLRDKDATVRRIFYMRFVLELTYPEIAEKTDIPVSTVKSKVYRTLLQFRKYYQEV